MYGRGIRNPIYNLDKIIESINRPPRSMEALLPVETTATPTSNSINNYDARINETREYWDEWEVVDIAHEDATEVKYINNW